MCYSKSSLPLLIGPLNAPLFDFSDRAALPPLSFEGPAKIVRVVHLRFLRPESAIAESAAELVRSLSPQTVAWFARDIPHVIQDIGLFLHIL